MIRRLRADGYKSLRGFEIKFPGPLTVLVGPNAAGKSNIIDLIKLVAATAATPLKKAFGAQRGEPIEAFDLRRKPEGKIRSFAVEVDVELSEDAVNAVRREMKSYGVTRPIKWETLLRYRLKIGFYEDTGKLFVMEEGLYPLVRDGSRVKKRGEKERFYIKTEKDKIVVNMEKQSHPKYRDLKMDRTVIQEPPYVSHHPHIWAFREEMRNVLAYYLDPYSMRTESPIVEAKTLESSGAPLAALMNTLKYESPQAFAAIKKDMGVFVEDITDIEVQRVPKTDKLILVLRESGIEISSRIVSEGTLRLLALLSITHSPQRPAVVAFEEPENGVHTARLSTLANIFKRAAEDLGIQFILTTHSPIFPRFFAPEEIQIIKKQEGYTRIMGLREALETLGYPIKKSRARTLVEDILREDPTVSDLVDIAINQR